MLELGRYQITAVNDGTFALDGGAMFGIVPKALWEKQLPADDKNRVSLALRCLLVTDTQSKRRILIDTGIGDKWDVKHAAMYKIDRGGGIAAALAQHGLKPEDITDVIVTHLHFDHAGGLTRRNSDGKLETTFPNATLHLQRRNWLWGHHPTEKDGGSYRQENFDILQHSGQLHLLEGATELFPDIELLISEGHTVALQLPRIHGNDTHLTYCGDLIPTRAHLKVSWVMAYDLYPLTTIEEKKMLLAQALEENGVLVFEHDPAVAACRLGERDGEPVFREAVEL